MVENKKDIFPSIALVDIFFASYQNDNYIACWHKREILLCSYCTFNRPHTLEAAFQHHDEPS